MDKRVFKYAKFVSVLLMLVICFSCDKQSFVENQEDIVEPQEEVDEGDFCSCVNLENVGKTIPLVNKYLGSLSKDLDDEQRLQKLVAWFKSNPCIIDARLILRETASGYLLKRDVAFSFMDDEIIRELFLDFSTTGKVLSYHYDITNSASVKTKSYFTIDRVFDFINSCELDVTLIYNGVYVSNMAPENLQYILDNLNAKSYTNDGNALWVSGYLHYLTNQITIFPRLYHMKNKVYQEDWLKSMNDYELVERPGYIIRFLIPEDPGKPQKQWEAKFKEYEFVEWAELGYSRYTIFDKSIEKEEFGGVGVSVDSDINIRMVEVFDVSPRTLQLHCSTTKIYSSGSNPIYVVCQQSSNNIDISFKGVAPIGITADIGPARATIDLGALSNGTYRLNLYNGDLKHTGELIVSSDNYKVNFVDQPEFRFTNSPLNKIPEQTIWGLIGYHKSETSSLVQSFFAALMDLGAEKKAYTPGYYNGFEIDKDGDITYPGALWGYWFDQPFIFHYSGNIENVEGLVKQYARDHREHMQIRINTDKGERFLSWMY